MFVSALASEIHPQYRHYADPNKGGTIGVSSVVRFAATSSTC